MNPPMAPGIPDECQTLTTATRVKVKARGRSAIISNPDQRRVTKTQVDGCVLQNQLACDWVISITREWDVFIELKGKDVSHAIDQLRATIDLWRARGVINQRAAALIVCSQRPKFGTTVQKAKAEFARRYKLPLHVETRNREYAVKEILSFSG